MTAHMPGVGYVDTGVPAMTREDVAFRILRDEAYRAVTAIDERHFTPEALEGCIKDFARHIYDLTDAIVARDERIALLHDVAHRAWHLMDDSGEIEGETGWQVLDIDHQALSDALDVLEGAGWNGCEQ